MDITWKYVKKLNDKDAVKKFLKKHNILLPEKIVKLLEQYNGGRPSEKSIFTSDNREHVFKALLSYNINDLESIYSIYPAVFNDTNLYPIGTDPAGNYVCYDYVNKKFMFLDHETGLVTEIVKMPF